MSQEHADMARALMESPVWSAVIVPLVQSRIRGNIELIKDRSNERRSKSPDDYLVGRWDEAELFLTSIVSMVNDWDAQVALQAQQEVEDKKLAELATFGRHSPYTSAPNFGDNEEQDDGGRG